jgi:hypothetical protein
MEILLEGEKLDSSDQIISNLSSVIVVDSLYFVLSEIKWTNKLQKIVRSPSEYRVHSENSLLTTLNKQSYVVPCF